MKLKPKISISSKHQQQQPIISTKLNSENQKRNKSRNPEFQQNWIESRKPKTKQKSKPIFSTKSNPEKRNWKRRKE
jgi:hypothetical protein